MNVEIAQLTKNYKKKILAILAKASKEFMVVSAYSLWLQLDLAIFVVGPISQ